MRRLCLTQTVIAIAAAAFLVVPPAVSLAVDEEPAAGEDSRGAAKLPDEALQPGTDSSQDDELFRNLLPGTAETQKPDDDLLERAIRGMRSAKERIDSRDSGPQTRELQQAVVKDLEELIEILKQQRQAQSNRAMAQSRPQNPDQQPVNPDARQSGDSTAADGGRTKDESAAESSDDPREAQQPETLTPVTQDELVRDVWGHLPPSQRQKLLNTYSDKYLPTYDELVRSYFAALAEAGRKKERTGPSF